VTRRAVDILATLPPSVRAMNAHAAAAAGPDAAEVLAARAVRAGHARQGRTAQRTGDAWEREVYAALDAAGLAWWAHTSPTSKRLRDGRVIVTGRALCDVVGATADGRALVAEVKRGAARVELVAGDRGGVQPHQRAQLDATARAGGVALLVVCVGDVRAVVPWCDLRDVRAVTATVARRYAVGTLAGALRGVAAPAGAADGAGRVETRVTPVARPHGAAAGDGGAAAKGATRR
jgi:hypothetical protein